MKVHSLVVAVLVTVLASPPSQAQSGPEVTGLFSNMGIGSSTGDVGGVELYITWGRDSFCGLFQMAEGVPDVPVFVKLEVQDSTIRFSFPADSRYAAGLQTFEGTVSRGGLRGRFANGYAVNLRRLKCGTR